MNKALAFILRKIQRHPLDSGVMALKERWKDGVFAKSKYLLLNEGGGEDWYGTAPKVKHKIDQAEAADVRAISLVGHTLRIDTRFWGHDVSWGDFHGCQLKETKFQGSIIDSATFLGAILDYCQFSPCYAKDADFRCTTITRSYFMDSDLQRTDFRFANVKTSGFDRCNFQGACFAFAVFENCEFDGADLRSAHFFCTKIKDCDLTDAKLDDTPSNRRMIRRAKAKGKDTIIWS